MDVRMEHTDGLGRKAEVWVGGHLLKVCDGVSEAEKRCPPGAMDDVRFSYVTEAGFTWEEAIRGNPSRRRGLEPLRGWAYAGFGQIVQVMPVVIDFGLMRMEDANWSSDERLVGRYVRVPIDRLEISRANEADWPKDAR